MGESPTYYYCQVQVVRVLAIANNGILPMASLLGGGNAASTSFIHGVVQLYLGFLLYHQEVFLCYGHAGYRPMYRAYYNFYNMM